ncbi:unnamed protein product [Rotaria socialis]
MRLDHTMSTEKHHVIDNYISRTNLDTNDLSSTTSRATTNGNHSNMLADDDLPDIDSTIYSSNSTCETVN